MPIEHPLVSVIIPVYNAAPWLSDCIESAMQSLKGISSEIICVDDGSTDGSPEILSAFNSAYDGIRVIRQDNAGRSAARNVGIEAARGKWLAFSDADDRLEPRGFRSMLSKAEFQEPDVVFGAARQIGSQTDKSTALVYFDDLMLDSSASQRYLLDFAYHAREKNESVGQTALAVHGQIDLCAVWASLYSGDIVRRNGIRFVDGLKFGEDTLFNYDFLSHVKSALYISDVVYAQNTSNTGTIRTYHSGDARYIGFLFPLWRSRVLRGDCLEADVASCLAREVMQIAGRIPLSCDEFGEAWSIAREFSSEWGGCVEPSRVGPASSAYWPYWKAQYALAKCGGVGFVGLFLLTRIYASIRGFRKGSSGNVG